MNRKRICMIKILEKGYVVIRVLRERMDSMIEDKWAYTTKNKYRSYMKFLTKPRKEE